MPRHPDISPSVSAIRGSAFSALAHRLATHRGDLYPLHVGDTWMEPPEGCRMQDLTVEEHPGMHRYSSPQGLPALLEAIAARSSARTGVPCTAKNVLVGAGATGALGAAAGTILDPGDQLIILAPFWPLIDGIVRSFHGEPVLVPFLGIDDAAGLVDALERARTDRTVGVYVNTPNNPTGRVFPRDWLAAIAVWARDNDLWILSDEVYEDYVYEGSHTYMISLAPERTFSAHSFSKAFGMAGNRCGYVVGPAELMGALRKVSTHAFYCSPTASQLAACRALAGPGDAWVKEASARYREMGNRAAARLSMDAPQGSTFLFLDVADRLGKDGLAGFLDRCADRGLFLAPGPSFGSFPTHVRACFTAAPPDVIDRGFGVLAEMLKR